MKTPKIAEEFIVHIPVRDANGQVVAQKEFVRLAGLVDLAFQLGLESVESKIEQLPAECNQWTAIVRAVARGRNGSFAGIGDASPTSVAAKLRPHYIRIADSRAVARALRLMTNVGMVALEELDELDERQAVPPVRPPGPRPAASAPSRKPSIATDAQRRMLFRSAYELGYQSRDAAAFIAQRLGVEPERATRQQASSLIDALTAEVNRARANGGERAAE